MLEANINMMGNIGEIVEDLGNQVVDLVGDMDHQLAREATEVDVDWSPIIQCWFTQRPSLLRILIGKACIHRVPQKLTYFAWNASYT